MPVSPDVNPELRWVVLVSLPVSAPYVRIDGLAVPVRVSGHAGLELCNTFAGWNQPPAKDYLLSYDHLAVWAGETGLLTSDYVRELRALAGHHPQQATAVLRRAREFRGQAYEVLLGRAEADTFQRFAEAVHAAGAKVRLINDGKIRREINLDAGLAAPILAAAWTASELLISPFRTQVRACPGNGCGWLFLDRSGRRRWCTMSTCGNRAKARRFASRQHGG